jgi:aminoglycoside phosphotransferase (APT) family kinase protein
MSSPTTSKPPEITLSLVIDLVARQFPHWSNLEIRPVELGGWDNRTFRLGVDMLVRLPSAEWYAPQVEKEHKLLPILAPHLSIRIPEPLVMGKPGRNYPFNWSIYRWIKGKSANSLSIDDASLLMLAERLATFLKELHEINAHGGPPPGPHNYFRGDSPIVYDHETRVAITELQNFIDVDAVTAVWEEAIHSNWNNNPVWVHGDFTAENILIRDDKLVAVIDFGCMAVGDPACDLVIAWTFFSNESRKIFRSHIGLDNDTWARARGWALWKALITFARLTDKTSAEASRHQKIITEILVENT